MKRTLSFLLSASLLLLPYSVRAGEAAEDSAEENRIILTIGDQASRSGPHYDGSQGKWQYLADLVGVELKYIYMTPEEYASRLASGDLPDIVATDKNLATIMESGVALDADPYLEEYCPNMLSGEMLETYEVFKQLSGDDGGFYFFPARIGYNGIGYSSRSSNRGYVVRWDYYKELGYPPINNEDDYLDVLLQMHENHPYTEEGYPTYLFGADGFSGYETAFRAELSVDYWIPYKYQNNIFTNEVYDGYVDTTHSMYWSAMEWQNKLYRAGKDNGSYDMELFTQSSAQYGAKCVRGQYLGLKSEYAGFYDASVKKDPDTLKGYCIVPTAAANYYTNVYQLLGNGPGYMWFISANSPHREEALKFFNCLADPQVVRELLYGREGVTWDYGADGVPRMTDYGRKQIEAYLAGTGGEANFYRRWGSDGVITSLPSNLPLLRDNSMHPDGYPIGFATISREFAVASMNSNISKDICEHYGVELPTDAFYQDGGLDFRNDCGEAISSCLSSLDRNQLRIISQAEALLADIQVDLVLAESDEEWQAVRDAAVNKIIELGEPEVFDAFREMWDEAAAVIVPLVHEMQEKNGVTPYTPEQYADHALGWEADRP